MDLPIICTLTETEFRERRRMILDSFVNDIEETVSTPDGYIFRFASKPGVLVRIANFVDREHQCCRFLSFKIVVEAGDGSVSLELTGPPEAKPLIAEFLGDRGV